jgi:2-iminobutanoate/2-iminopropanoate deaminase
VEESIMAVEFIKPPGGMTESATASGYGPAVRSGDQVFISGMTARNAQGVVVGKGDPEAQAVQIYENIKTCVEAAGGTLSDVILLRTYLTDRSQRAAHGAVRRKYFPGPDFPCSTLLIVAGLADPDFLMEVEAVAHIAKR